MSVEPNGFNCLRVAVSKFSNEASSYMPMPAAERGNSISEAVFALSLAGIWTMRVDVEPAPYMTNLNAVLEYWSKHPCIWVGKNRRQIMHAEAGTVSKAPPEWMSSLSSILILKLPYDWQDHG